MIKSVRAFLAIGLLACLSMLPASAANISLDGNLVIPNVCTVTGTTPQTCNAISGAVTTGTLTTAAATNAAYTINNSAVVASSRVNCSIMGYSGTIVTNGYPIIISCVPGTGTIVVNLTNTHAANALNGTVVIGFWVVN